MRGGGGGVSLFVFAVWAGHGRSLTYPSAWLGGGRAFTHLPVCLARLQATQQQERPNNKKKHLFLLSREEGSITPILHKLYCTRILYSHIPY